MSKTTTPEKLILYYFNETCLTDTVLVQRAIDRDPEIWAEYASLKRAFRMVDRALTNPSRNSIEKILRYSALTAPAVN